MEKWLKIGTLKRSASRTEIRTTDLATMEITVDQQDDNHEMQRPTEWSAQADSWRIFSFSSKRNTKVDHFFLKAFQEENLPPYLGVNETSTSGTTYVFQGRLSNGRRNSSSLVFNTWTRLDMLEQDWRQRR
ncbi:hypothetical protein AVEN_214122-1 [Araneus ventricosus]|uniref:Uncharacterized protein n=1 Tax=Araneus ventricosus TaxID=182803 RepID=A0A4Y2C6I0_ARAVE|nr:hypothetical protein AVEN_214122-1 [Araneus ventricosus]